MMDLSSIKTKDLLNELASRPGVEKSSCGLYKPYELKKKYNDDREPVEADTILIIKDRDMEWRRFELCFETEPEKRELYQLLDRLVLSRRELALIVLGLRARPGFELKDFDT